MKNAILKVVIALISLIWSTMSYSSLFIESREAKRSDYYTGQTGSASIRYYSLLEWLELRRQSGRTDDSAIADGSFVIDDPYLLEEPYKIANRLLENWPGTVPEMAIFFVAGSSTSYEAYTTRENEILIMTGVLEHAKSYEEFQAVIAHELSHILLNHTAKLDYLRTADHLFRSYAQTETLISNVEAFSYDNANGLNFEPNSEYWEEMREIRERHDLALRFYGSLHATLFSRGDENDADKLAVDLMVAANYYPSGVYKFMENLSASYLINTSVKDILTTQTGRLLEQYTIELQSVLESGEDISSESFDASNAFTSFSDSIVDVSKNVLTGLALDILDSSHPVPNRRRERYSKYINEEYPPKIANQGTEGEDFNEFKTQDEITRLLKKTSIGMAALDYLTLSMKLEAGELLPELEHLTDFEDAFGAYVNFKVLKNQGRHSEAVAALNQLSVYHYLPNVDAVEMATYLLTHQGESGKLQAADIVTQKERYLGTIPHFYPVKLTLAQMDADSDLLESIASECIARHADDEQLYRACAPHAGINLTQPITPRGGLFDSFNNIGDSLNNELRNVFDNNRRSQ